MYVLHLQLVKEQVWESSRHAMTERHTRSVFTVIIMQRTTGFLPQRNSQIYQTWDILHAWKSIHTLRSLWNVGLSLLLSVAQLEAKVMCTKALVHLVTYLLCPTRKTVSYCSSKRGRSPFVSYAWHWKCLLSQRLEETPLQCKNCGLVWWLSSRCAFEYQEINRQVSLLTQPCTYILGLATCIHSPKDHDEEFLYKGFK